jgi:hypothetical protein
MAKAFTSIATLVMVIMIMVSIVKSIPDSIGGNGAAIQIAYTSDPANTSPTDYAKAILSSR